MKSLFAKLGRSNTRLTRPDFSKSRKELFNFSDTAVEIADPKQTALISLHTSKNKIDIYSMGDDYLQKIGNYVQLVYKRGWDFWGKDADSKGGVICDMRVSYFPEKLIRNFNQFRIDDQVRSLLIHWFVVWGDEAGATKLGEKGKNKNFVYPTQKKDIEILDKQGIAWLKSKGTYKGEAPLVKYSIPLSAKHNLIISFEVHAYDGLDFHSTETNIKETTYSVINDFMERIKIKYSDKSLEDLKQSNTTLN